jgi:hypothetical protein
MRRGKQNLNLTKNSSGIFNSDGMDGHDGNNCLIPSCLTKKPKRHVTEYGSESGTVFLC